MEKTQGLRTFKLWLGMLARRRLGTLLRQAGSRGKGTFTAIFGRHASLRVRLLTLFVSMGASGALAQQIQAGGKNDPIAFFKSGVCGTGGVIGLITNPVILLGAAIIAVAVFGYSKYMGRIDAFGALVNSGVGLVAVMACVTIAGLFFGTGC